MTLYEHSTGSPLDQVYIALDLETTGLSPESDEIIEVGAVKFQGETVLDTFSSLVNPSRTLSPFILNLTGISQAEIDGAAPFGNLSQSLVEFLGEFPLVGHNIGFDLRFLARQGLRFNSFTLDTWDLASLFLPQQERSLSALIAVLDIPHSQAHRALSDADATRRLLITLLNQAVNLSPNLLGELNRLASIARWPLHKLLKDLEREAEIRNPSNQTRIGVGGLDLGNLRARLHPSRFKKSIHVTDEPLEEAVLVKMLRDKGPLAEILPQYQPRKEQIAMIRSVCRAINNERHLLVEAGTGVGKSIAYLLPAILSAVRKGKKVVVSTNTINLQEQLFHKDIPTAVALLEKTNEITPGELRFSMLKGRANYLCMRRWTRMRSAEGLSVDEARFHGKLLMWLQNTKTGDRAELALGGPENEFWDRYSAQGSTECPVTGGNPCCLQAARDRASDANVVVINHALLLADLQQGGGLIPDYDSIIIDEAHHLEEQATRQFGFRILHETLLEIWDALTNSRGLGMEIVKAYRGSVAADQRRQGTEINVESLVDSVERARTKSETLFSKSKMFLLEHSDGTDGQRPQMLVTSATRAQPDWSSLEIAGEDLQDAIREGIRRLQDLYRSLDGLENASLLNYEELRNELNARIDQLREIHDRLGEFFFQTDAANAVYWVENTGNSNIALNVAPLNVGPLLEEALFNKKKTVVLTSATLSSDGNFSDLRQRLGLEEADELVVDSPFDFTKAAVVFLPEDMPEPAANDYLDVLSTTIADLASSAGGHTMALFTSYASLRSARANIQRHMRNHEIRVLAQGVDGTPKRLLEEFLKNPKAVLLGTASFWEGVDLAGEALQVLILTRLPFDVPTEPVFAARSQRYEEPFQEYALPQAILRFRQGFGRLIRTHRDKGVVVVLDRRITSRSYGQQFLRALPFCGVERVNLKHLSALTTSWLKG